jgi:hypothetical protein
MTADFSKNEFFQFLDYVSEQNLIRFETVRGWRVAASKLMSVLSEAEEADIRTIDLDLAVHRVANRDPGSVSPRSLRTYQLRVAIALREFKRWREDPGSYQPRGLDGLSGAKANGDRIARQGQSKIISTPTLTSEKHEKETTHTSSGLTLSYPLRVDFLAQVVIPRDLSTIEAKRLGAFLLTIAIDYQPE